MGDISSLLQSLFGTSTASTTSGIPAVPTTSQLTDGVTNQTGGISDALGKMSGLQLGQLGLSGLSGVLNGYLGWQNMNTAKSQASNAQNNWNKQWDANVKTTNASLADRQRARLASNPNGYESVDSYMKKYGIS